MEFSAIIAEYNPFTNGHLHHIKTTKEKFGLPIICIMSGNFVQRGEIAILNKYIRAKHAILAGADIVIELPTVYALSSAQDFAFGAVRTLNALGCIKYLSFGSESGDIEQLKKIAEELISLDNTKNFKSVSKSGKSYASNILELVSKQSKEIISKPNNILGIEYIKSIINTNSKIVPLTIKREDNFNDTSTKNFVLPSASAVRKLVYELQFDNAKAFVPEFVLEDLKTVDEKAINFFKDYMTLILKQSDTSTLSKISEVTEGLEFRIKESALNSSNYANFTDKVYTKRYKNSKINRIVLKSNLGITKQIIEQAKKSKPYAKILAMNNKSKDYISLFPKDKINIIMTKRDYQNLDKKQQIIINKDLFASQLSSLPHKINANTDFTIGTLIVK